MSVPGDTPNATAGPGLADRTPSHDVDWLRGVARRALADFDLPARTAVSIVGSIAEGFGNDCSDIDVLALVPDGSDPPSVRQMTVEGGQRVEVFFWTLARARQLARDTLRAIEDDTGEHRAELDAFHRVAYALPLLNEAVVRDIQAGFDRAWLAAVRSDRERAAAVRAARRANVLLPMNRADEALAYGKLALRHAARAWACARGETYFAEKFTLRQLARAGCSSALIERLRTLMSVTSASDGFGASVVSVAAEFELVLPESTSANAVLLDQSVLLRFGKQLLVCRAATTFAASDPRQELERALQSGADQPFAAQPSNVCAQLGLLHRAGLLALRLPGDEVWIDDRPPRLVGELRVSSIGPLISEDVVVSDLSSTALLHAGAELVGHAFAIENAEEDAVGALRRADWYMLEVALREIAYRSAEIVVSHHVARTPQRHELRDALLGCGSSEALSVALTRVEGLRIDGLEDVADFYAAVCVVRASIPAQVVSGHFAGCHNSATAWEKLLRRVIRPWATAAQALDVALPRELAELFHAALEPPAINRDALEQRLGWSRDMNLRQEIERATRALWSAQ